MKGCVLGDASETHAATAPPCIGGVRHCGGYVGGDRGRSCWSTGGRGRFGGREAEAGKWRNESSLTLARWEESKECIDGECYESSIDHKQ